MLKSKYFEEILFIESEFKFLLIFFGRQSREAVCLRALKLN